VLYRRAILLPLLADDQCSVGSAFDIPGESQRFLIVAMCELKKLIGIEHGLLKGFGARLAEWESTWRDLTRHILPTNSPD